MKHIFWLFLLFPFAGFGQPSVFKVESKTDTLVSCGEKFLIKQEIRTLQLGQRIIDVSDLSISTLKPKKNGRFLAEKSLTEPEMRQWLKDSEEQYYSERNYYERISETILEVIKAKSHTFEGAAHGEHWSENYFLDLKTRTTFSLNDVFTEAAFPLIYQIARQELQKQNYELPTGSEFKINQYGFSPENFVITFQYLDPDSPIPVSYAQQAVELEIPFKALLPHIKMESPIYKMVTKNSCR